MPGWVAVPYLILAILTLLAVNTIDLYSSGLTLQAIGVPVRRPAAALIDLVICVAITFVAIFSASFNRLYLGFLSLLIVWLAPWFAIYIADWLLRRGRYDPASLVRENGGRYWRRGGVHWPGVIAQAVGMVASLMWINSPAYTGPLSSRAGGSDLSVFTGMAAAGLAYWLLARRTVPAEEGLPVPVPASLVPRSLKPSSRGQAGNPGGRLERAGGYRLARFPLPPRLLRIDLWRTDLQHVMVG